MAKGFDEDAWRASNDARTLAEANAIMGDKGRLKKAQAAAKKEYESTMKSAGAMKNVFSCGGKATTAKERNNMKTAWIFSGLMALILLVLFGFSCLSAAIFMLLWNWILPLFGVIKLSFWQSWGVTILLGIVGSFFNQRNLTNLQRKLDILNKKLERDIEEEKREFSASIAKDVVENKDIPEEEVKVKQESPVEETAKEVTQVKPKPKRKRKPKKEVKEGENKKVE